MIFVKVSILSPVCDEAKFIEDMIRSVQDQSYDNWELIFVDDASTDSTPDLIDAASTHDQRIRLVSRGAKLGKVRAFNAAFAASRGDIVILLAGDDLLPRNSLSLRVSAFDHHDPSSGTVAFYKLQTFSEIPGFDGMVLPRGKNSSRSGGSITMNRKLARKVFPIPEFLVAEDVWLGYATLALAATVLEFPDVVLLYRIHDHNSNPRGRPFAEMSLAMHARHQAYPALLDATHLKLGEPTKAELSALWTAEKLRFDGRTISLFLDCRVPFIDRLAMASMSNRSLYYIRRRFYSLLSGWRRR